MATPRGGGLSQKAAPALSPGLKLSRDKTDFINQELHVTQPGYRKLCRCIGLHIHIPIVAAWPIKQLQPGQSKSSILTNQIVTAWPIKQLQPDESNSCSLSNQIVVVWPIKQLQLDQSNSCSLANQIVAVWPIKQLQPDQSNSCSGSPTNQIIAA